MLLKFRTPKWVINVLSRAFIASLPEVKYSQRGLIVGLHRNRQASFLVDDVDQTHLDTRTETSVAD